MNLLSLAAVAPSPWKNGGGTTRELLAWPSAADWRVRLSVAEIAADGPFSGFPGVERWFAVLSGAGVRLDLDGVERSLGAQDEPLAFDGAAAPGCRLLDGPTQDFNLMLRGATGSMQRVRGRLERSIAAPALIAVYAHSASAAGRFGSEDHPIPPASLGWLILDRPAAVAVTGADALWMEIAL